MGSLASGNRTVDAIGTLHLSGNVVPQIWYKTITKETGKPYLLAITLLADIVYWYRPTEVRDERSGQIIGWRKKFKGDLLQKLKLNGGHVEYVMQCMKETSTKITNMRSYLITILYNAPSTINHYYQQEVQHNMFGGGWNEKGSD